jgi:hypothetical protein
VRLTKVAWFLGVTLLSAGMALADGIDPRVTPGRGPTGSPPFTSVFDLTGSETFTVVNGTVTAISINLPEADVSAGFVLTCGVSNAFLDGPGAVHVDLMGAYFNAASDPTTGQTCNYTSFTGVNNDPAGSNESILQQEIECTATNLGLINDPDDCAGVPQDTSANQSQSGDVKFTVSGPLPGPDLAPLGVTAVITPEPASFSLLLVGLTGVFAYRRRKLA